MRYLSICSGIEAASVAWERLGFTAAGFSEIDPFASSVLAARFRSNLPGEPLSANAPPNFGDFTAIPLDVLGPVDLLVGGTPCQAFSFAGKRLSLADARGNLTLAFAVLAHELARSHGLRNALWENVPGVLSTPDNAFGCFLGAIVGADAAIDLPAGIGRWPDAGMVAGPRARAAWRVLDAQYFRLAQRRERVFVVVDFGNGADPAAVLFEPQGLQGNSPPRREAGEKPAATVTASTGGCSGKDGIDGRLAYGGGNRSGPVDVAATLTAKGQRIDFEVETFIAGPAHTLRGEGFDASEDGTGRGTPIVPCVVGPLSANGGTCKKHGYGMGQQDWESGYAIPICFDRRQTDVLVHGDMTGPLDTDGYSVGVAYDLRGREGGAQFEGPHDTANIRAANGGSSRSYLLTKEQEHASASEANAGTILRAMREALGAEAFAEWGLGILDSLQPQEVLRPEVHGGGVRHPAQTEGGLVSIAQAGEADYAARSLREVRCAGGARCAPSGSRLAEQRPVELGAALSLLSQSRTQQSAFLHGLWQASEGLGVLREALSALQEIRRSAADQGQPAYAGWAVRRLTPTEAARLQGFPDHHARIAWRGKPAELCPDGPQYKTYGNSMAVNVMRWLGERLKANMPIRKGNTDG